MARRMPASSKSLPPAHAMTGNGSNMGYPTNAPNTNMNSGNYASQSYSNSAQTASYPLPQGANGHSQPPPAQQQHHHHQQPHGQYYGSQPQYEVNQRQGAAHPVSNGQYHSAPAQNQQQFRQQEYADMNYHQQQQQQPHQPHVQQQQQAPQPQPQPQQQQQQYQQRQNRPSNSMPQPQSNNNRQPSGGNVPQNTNGYQRTQQQQLQGPRSYPMNDANTLQPQQSYTNSRPQMSNNNSFNSNHSEHSNHSSHSNFNANVISNDDIFDDEIEFHVPSSTSNPRQVSNTSNSSSNYALDKVPESQQPSRQTSINTTTTTTTTNMDDTRINALEEKIQQLEKALALTELKNKVESRTASSTSSLSIYTPAITTEDVDERETHNNTPPPLLSSPPTIQGNRSSSILETVPLPSSKPSSSSSSELNHPPVPPLPPLEQRRSKSFFDSKSSKSLEVPEKKSHEKTLSQNSLIPTTSKSSKVNSSGSYDFDLDVYDDDDHLDEEPPPSYAELEQSGSLTYSQSIYRTGFEKAGFKMNEKNAIGTNIGNSSSSRSNGTGSSDGSSAAMLASPPMSLKMKRKLPPPLPEVKYEDLNQTVTKPRVSSFNNNVDLERPTQQFIDAPIKPIVTKSERNTQRLPVSPPMNRPIHARPTQRFVDDDDNDDDEYEEDENSDLPELPVQPPSLGKKRLDLLAKQPPMETVNKPLEKPFKIDPRKATVLSNGMIQPILPSESKESLDSLRRRFFKIRERAYNDYKSFTPQIQFEWAIMLLEALDKPSFISKVSIDAGIRKNPIPLKDLGKEKFLFLNTSIKVLNIIIDKDPNATRARLYLGDIYSGGIHSGIVPKDEIKGYKLFLDAATIQNDPVAYYRVACCLEVGVGTEKNVELAYKYLDRASILGDPSAMYQLGVALFAGNQLKEPDVKASLNLYQQAIEKLKDPMIMGRDPLIATRNFKNARDILYTLAKIYQTDVELLKLTDKKNSSVLNKIDQLKKLGVYKNRERSLSYYLEAAKLGHAEAETALGFYYKEGCFPTEDFQKEEESMRSRNPKGIISPSRSIYWYSKAAANNQIYAAMGLAKWYASGAEGVLEKDPEQAFLWMRKAADEGELTEAQYMVAKCFQQGFGCKESIKHAVLYYKKSAVKGHHMALQRLKDITNRRI